MTLEVVIGERVQTSGAGRTFEALYREHRHGLVRLAAMTLGSTAHADDVVQEAFAALHRQLDRVESPSAWLRVVVVRACLNERRRRSTAGRYAPRLMPGPSGDPAPTEPLVDAVSRLPLRQRTAVVLRFYADLSEAETARVMGVSVGTVKSTVHRALERLREEIHRD